MEIAYKDELNGYIRKWVDKQPLALLAGVAIGFSVVAYFIYSGKKNEKLHLNEGIREPNLSMERYVFEITAENSLKQAIVESSGDCYSVSLDGQFVGTMWRNEEAGMQWQTTDSNLEKYLPEITSNLVGAFSRKGFPALLRGAYPEITHTDWKSSETLEVELSQDVDIEVFTAFLKDEVNNLVDFNDHLDLIVKREGNSYFQIVGIN